MSIHVLHPGLLTTIQDRGRFGSQKYGVIVSGAMDQLSHRIANMLVDNNENEATLEVTFFGTRLECKKDNLIAITGGDLQPTINGKKAPMWRPILLQKGERLHFSSARKGSRAYIAIAGGIDVPEVMGSKSTYIYAEMGGFNGRPLKKGDTLLSGKRSSVAERLIEHLKRDHSVTWSVHSNHFFSFPKKQTIRVLKGSEFDRFTEESKQAFTSDYFKVTTDADRMGYQLTGETLHLLEPINMLSEGVTYGTIQVPTSGQLIILMADRQTTGGYPKIAQVITADLPKLAQLQPNDDIEFSIVNMDEAEHALFQQEKDLRELALAIQFKAIHLGRPTYG